jgi:hypothetical protein
MSAASTACQQQVKQQASKARQQQAKAASKACQQQAKQQVKHVSSKQSSKHSMSAAK